MIKNLKGLLIILFAVLSLALDASADNPAPLSYVKDRLISDGYDREIIERLYSNPSVEFSPKCIMLFFPKSGGGPARPPSKTSMHDQFLTPQAIGKAEKFIRSNRQILSNAEKQYGVDYCVVTAIMLVETRLGENTGNWPVVNSLSTLAALGDTENRKMFWDIMPSERKQSRTYYEERAKKKAEWAYSELKAFLDLAIMAGASPESVTGSYAGAIGIPQFMPSNILSLGKDGDSDSYIDLFSYSDAIFSIANYLSESGWRRGIEYDRAYSVILKYNKSGTYARTILEIARRLKGA